MFKPMERVWEKNCPPWYPKYYEFGRESLVWHLNNHSWYEPDKPAVIYYGTVITYKELNDLVWRVAGGLQKLGVKKGDRIYIGLQNCPQFIIAYYAAMALGAISITGSPMYKGGELTFVLNDCSPKVVIIEDALFSIFQAIRNQAPSVEHVVVAALCEYLPAEPTLPVPFDRVPVQGEFPDSITWQQLAGSDPIDKLTELDIKQDIAMLQYTSGTTGNPKGAILTHFNILASATNSAINRLRTKDDIHLCALPLFHVNGSNNILNAPIISGGTIVLLSRIDVETMFKAIELYRCTTWVATTTLNIAFIEHPKMKDYDLSSLKKTGTGGAPLPQALFKKYLELFDVELEDGFGMSETMAYTIANPRGYSKVGALGFPVPMVDIRIANLDDETKDAAIGEDGELWQRGPSVGIGYWNSPEASAESFIKQDDSEYMWLKTGDIVCMDEDGYLWLRGRTKEMIKASGFSVYPAEVEDYLYRHPAVSECCVIGIPHEYKGEEIKAYVVLRPEYQGQVTEQELIDWAKEQMSAYKYPRMIEFRDSLPKSATNKILRKVLKAEEAERS